MVVAPFTGAWIEMLSYLEPTWIWWQVAPFTGAWIEISEIGKNTVDAKQVAPFTGAWIEIVNELFLIGK